MESQWVTFEYIAKHGLRAPVLFPPQPRTLPPPSSPLPLPPLCSQHSQQAGEPAVELRRGVRRARGGSRAAALHQLRQDHAGRG